MKSIYPLLLLTAVFYSCKGTSLPQEEPVMETPEQETPESGESSPETPPPPEPKAPETEETVTISFTIVDNFPYYYALAGQAVPCDVMVIDRHDNRYPIGAGEARSALQYDAAQDGHCPERRECIVATVIATATGESSYEENGVYYSFRTGSYDE